MLNTHHTINTMRKIFFTIFLTALGWGYLNAQCISGDCQNGTGILLMPDGSRYIGEFERGNRHGMGTCHYPDGSVYRGQWSSDLPEGEGVKTLASGKVVEGVWSSGTLDRHIQISPTLFSKKLANSDMPSGCISGNCYDGKGIYVYPSGSMYVGQFKGGEIHGIGVCYYADGSRYQGEWEHRYPHGEGTLTYSDGTSRTGAWNRGQPVESDGYSLDSGISLITDGSNLQTGCLSGNCKEGEGIYAYADGSRYEGQFRRQRPNGFGVFYYLNGDRYEGNFKAGFRHGQGTLYKENGSRQAGWWNEGEFAGSGNQASRLGCLTGNCQNGFGTYVFDTGERYTGSFRDGLPEGKGTVIYPNGERYEGEMAKGWFNGQGTLYLVDGRDISGHWEDGKYQGIPEKSPLQTGTFAGPGGAKIRVWAVIIGISSYNHMPVLRYTDDDAYRIYAFLKSPEGGGLPDDQVRILIDEAATRGNILKTMSQVFGKAGPNDLVFLYFSGHGLRGSFLPIDFDGFSNKLYHEEITQILDNSPAKYKLCLADACHSGSLLAMRGVDIPSVLKGYYDNLARARAGTALIMSSKSDETSLESSGLRQGVFSHFLIRGLKGEADDNDNKVVTVKELFDFVYDNVREYTGSLQSPVIDGAYDPEMPVSVVRE